MRTLNKAATSMAAVGLLAFGAVAVSGSSALASNDQSVTACTATLGALALGLVPSCTAGDSTIDNPTSITVSVNTTSLGALLDRIPGLGEEATWTLACVVNGGLVSVPGSYTVTSVAQSASDVIDLQTAVGSPDPGQCTVSDLTVTTTLALSIGALGLGAITIGANATADTGTPGAVYANYPADQAGAHAEVCADDTGNGNAGTSTQGFQCLSDLADYWIQLGTGQFVHNGDCLTDARGTVTIQRCIAGPPDNSGQVWSGNSGSAGELTNADGNGCLTAPSSGTIDSAVLRVAACHHAVGQEWTIPNATPV